MCVVESSVVLTVPVPVLKIRKRERDGDEDIGPEVATVPDEQKVYGRLVFDTEQEETSRIASAILKWILSNPRAEGDGLKPAP